MRPGSPMIIAASSPMRTRTSTQRASPALSCGGRTARRPPATSTATAIGHRRSARGLAGCDGGPGVVIDRLPALLISPRSHAERPRPRHRAGAGLRHAQQHGPAFSRVDHPSGMTLAAESWAALAPVRLALLIAAAAALAPGPRARRHGGPGEFLGERQQRVRRAGDDVAGDVDDPLAPAACGRSELLECLPRPDPVPLGQDPDRLLHPDPDRQRAFQLADCRPEPPRLIRTAFVTSLVRREPRGPLPPGGLRRGACRGAGAAGPALAAASPAGPRSSDASAAGSGSSAAIRSASTMAQVRSPASSSPTLQPAGVRRSTATSGASAEPAGEG